MRHAPTSMYANLRRECRYEKFQVPTFKLHGERKRPTPSPCLMIHHFFLNLSLAFVWCLLQDEISLQQFLIGYVLPLAVWRRVVR